VSKAEPTILQNDFKRQWDFIEEAALCAVRRVVSLPVHPFMTNEEVDAAARACTDWSPS
jgi:hypothetical protein